jgi:uncharacterized protein YndB with AHSA1/START domain
MPNIAHRIGIQAPARQVYSALSTIDGLAGWWTRRTSGESRPGRLIEFGFENPEGQEMGRFEMEVLELTDDERVRWRVKAGPADWIGTELSFGISEEDGQSIVQFAHRGWREETASMDHCSMKWATFLLSLRELVERGRGRPAPDDLKIDNWN